MKLRFFTAIISILLAKGMIMAQEGRLLGRVLDMSTNEPVPFANIIVEGTNIGTVSDIEGNFSFEGLEPGFVRLRASYVGFRQTLSSDIQIMNSREAYLEIYMEPSSLEIEEVVVKVSPYYKPVEAPVSMQRINLEEIETNPGSNRDISKVVQSFPGIGFTPSFRNDIIVRGGGPSENVYYLDEVEIPNLNHFSTQGASGGATGIINADLLQSANYFSGAFPANHPNALSSVFELQQKEGNKEKPRFRFSLGASEAALSGDGPVGDKSTYLFSMRRSYLQFLFDALELPFLPNFTDYQVLWKTRFNEKNELKLVSIGSIDEFALNTDLKDPDEQQEYILSFLPVNEQWSYTIGGVYKHYRSNGFQSFVLSRNMLNNTSYKYPDNNESMDKILDYHSQEIENKFRYEQTIYFEELKVNYSLDGAYAKYSNNTRQRFYIDGEVQDLVYDTDLDMFSWGASVQLNKGFLDEQLNLTVGLRADANSYSKSMNNLLDQLSPRASLTYKLNEKLSLTVNSGKYFRRPPYTALGFKDSNGNLINKENELKYIGVSHLVGGLEYLFKSNFLFSLEGFYKSYSNYPFSVNDSISLATKGADYGTVGDEELRSTGIGRAYGFEFLSRGRIDNKLNYIFAYTYVVSEAGEDKEDLVPTAWDSRHIISTTLTYNFGKNWSVGSKWRFSGALPYTPYDMELSANIDAWDSQGGAYLDYGRLNSERLSAFHQLDLRIDKRFYFNKWSLMLYLDIENLYNFQSEQPDFIVREKDGDGNYLTNDEGTEYILRSVANTSGTVLPTIGIMMEF